jgi:putative FmdB family regulatory protein
MPLYEYQCESCNHRFEVIQKFSDPPPDVCPVCGKGPVRQLLSSPAIQFKGSGWYVTDYARKGQSDSNSGSSSKSDAGTKDAGGDTGKKDTPTTGDQSVASTKSSTTTPPISGTKE